MALRKVPHPELVEGRTTEFQQKITRIVAQRTRAISASAAAGARTLAPEMK
jgi:hypothetical protein